MKTSRPCLSRSYGRSILPKRSCFLPSAAASTTIQTMRKIRSLPLSRLIRHRCFMIQPWLHLLCPIEQRQYIHSVFEKYWKQFLVIHSKLVRGAVEQIWMRQFTTFPKKHTTSSSVHPLRSIVISRAHQRAELCYQTPFFQMWIPLLMITTTVVANV